MRKKNYTIIGLVLAVLLVLLLVYVKNTKQADSSKDPDKIEQTTKKSTSQSSKNETSTSQSKQEEVAQDTQNSQSSSQSSANQGSSQPSASQNDKKGSTQGSKASSSIDPNALGTDYSSIAGTWTNNQGESITITADGQVTYASSADTVYGLQSQGVYDGVYYAGIYNPNQIGSAAFIVIPAGATNPNTGGVSDTDMIAIGQDASAYDHPFTRS